MVPEDRVEKHWVRVKSDSSLVLFRGNSLSILTCIFCYKLEFNSYNTNLPTPVDRL